MAEVQDQRPKEWRWSSGVVSLSAENLFRFCDAFGKPLRSASGSFTSSSGSDDVGRSRMKWMAQSFNPLLLSTFDWKWEQNKCTQKAATLTPRFQHFKTCSGSVRTLQEANEARYAISQEVLVYRITRFAVGIQFQVISSVWWLTC